MQQLPMHDERAGPAAAPRSVAELERDPAWRVLRGESGGSWLTAERHLHVGGRHWRIGLTPVDEEVAALIVWADGELVAHRRGPEAVVCAAAYRWVGDIDASAAAVAP